jgi:hypothetical protein
MGSAGNQLEAKLRVYAAGGRGREPFTCGVPWPKGAAPADAGFELLNAHGQPEAVQAHALNQWSDGSARWLLVDWQAEAGEGTEFRLRLSQAEEPKPHKTQLKVDVSTGRIEVDTGPAAFFLVIGTEFPFRSVYRHQEKLLDETRTGLAIEDEQGRVFRPHVESLELVEAGPVRAVVRLRGAFVAEGTTPLADLDACLHFFAGSAAVRFEVTIRNSRKAEHPGGLWDLGNGGSIYLRDAALTVALPPGEAISNAHCSAETGTPFEVVTLPLELYQDSSGGENWKSSNHLNRQHIVPNTFRGYRLRTGGGEFNGLRATPALYMRRGELVLGVAVPCFWQNFPKAIEATPEGVLTLRLFPRQYADVHELQGGEQKTHTFSILFGAEGPVEPQLEWCRSPGRAAARPEWCELTGAIPYLTHRAVDPYKSYLNLVDAAIEGEDTFDHKREVIDEYGWRHFGDIYGDHEAVFHKGPTPLVSHYNNQYDPVAGFAYQFLRSGDVRWLRHMEELAAHVMDIDLYHTDQDKSAYNHGLFWHTFHYVDADTGTHRSYPRAARVCGGGPANEQNYATGLMLHYFMTGNPAAREAAVRLGQWVIDMDDGSKTVFRWLAGGNTGLASSSRTPDYQGPGRGAANSIAALLDAHQLGRNPDFLAKAEQIIRRCVHPTDNVEARNLLDAENRWFYTMFLQSLGKYLDYKAERGELDHTYAYARASLLHYARWMAKSEYPYLEKPEKLEYPTETWAAQDMRKSEIFKFAAKHAQGEERAAFLERSEFFFRYSTTALSGMKTRTLARPVVLLLSYGFMHAYFHHNPNVAAPSPTATSHDFGRPEVFIPQKVKAKKRFVMLAGLGAVGALAGIGLLLAYLLS